MLICGVIGGLRHASLAACLWGGLMLLAMTFADEAQAAPTKRIAVLEIATGPTVPLTAAEAGILTDTIRGSVLSLGEYQVLTRENILELLPPDKQDLASCVGNCEVETGRNLGVEFVAVADVHAFGTLLRLTVRLYDTRSASLLGQETADAPNVNALDEGGRAAAEKVFAHLATAPDVVEGRMPGFEAPGKATRLNATLVAFSSDPPGAVVHLDGKILCAAAPCSKLVAFGPHNVAMEAEMYDRREESVRVDDKLTLDWRLRPNFATLEVRSAAPGVQVQVDGVDAGLTPVSGLRVATGGHRVEVDPKCWLDAGLQIKVDAGERRALELGTQARTKAVQVLPRDRLGNDVAASLAVDGAPAGEAPAAVDVPICASELVAKQQGGGSARIDVAQLSDTWAPTLGMGLAAEAPEVSEEPRTWSPLVDPRVYRGLGWGALGLAVAAVAGGALMSESNASDGAALKKAPRSSTLADSVDRSYAVGWALYGTAGALAITGGLLLVEF